MVVEDTCVPLFTPYDVVYSVTVRNAGFTPAVNALVDAFRFDAEERHGHALLLGWDV